MHRLSQNVTAMTALVLDIDHGLEAVDRVREAAARLGIEAWLWETHSSTQTHARWRAVLPFELPLDVASRRHWSQELWRALLTALSVPVSWVDSACSDPARLYYLPSRPSDSGHSFAFEHIDGRRWDVSWAAARAPIEPPPPRVNTSAESERFNLAELRDAVARFPCARDAKPLIARLLLGKSLSPPIVRQPGELPRHLAWLTATRVVAQAAPACPAEVLHELLRPSWDAEVMESPEDYTAWETIERQLAGALEKAAEWAAERARRDEEISAKVTQLFAPTVEDSTPNEASATKTPEVAPPDEVLLKGIELPAEALSRTASVDDDWRSKIAWHEAPDGSTKPTKELGNILNLLCHHPESPLRYAAMDMRADRVLIDGVPCNDNTMTHVRVWLNTPANGGIRLGHEDAYRAIQVIGARRAFDPVAYWLRSLKWDGRPRVDGWLQRYFSAQSQTDGYVDIVGRRFLVQMVARGLDPGCEAHGVLVFSGGQGTGKTRGVMALAGRDPWFATLESLSNLRSAREQIVGRWVVELGELSGLTRAEVDDVKAFLTARSDKFRPAYGRSVVEYQRGCVFVGTTNEVEFLRDPTGERRFWPVQLPQTGFVRLDHLVRDRDQLLAEAVQLYLSGERTYLSGGEESLQRAEAQYYSGSTAVSLCQEAIIDMYRRASPAGRSQLAAATTQQLITALAAIGYTATPNALGRAVRLLGFTVSTVGRERLYSAPAELLNMVGRKPATPATPATVIPLSREPRS